MSFLTQIESRVGTVSDTAYVSEALTAGAAWFVDRLPENKLRDYTTNVSDGGSGVSITDYRFYRAHKSGYKAREVDPGLKAQAADSDSIHKATATDPIFYIENGLIYILPGGGTAIVIAYPTVAYSGTTISGFPTELNEGVVLYTSIQAAVQKYNATITVLNGLGIPTTTFSLTQANTWINTDEDIELGNAELSQQRAYLEKYSQDMQLLNAEVSKEIQEVNSLGGILKELRDEFKTFVSGII